MVFMKSFDFSQKEILKLFLTVATLILILARFLTNHIGFNVCLYSLDPNKQINVHIQ